jgi:drug/metabolite transporter (DMT)-like permease
VFNTAFALCYKIAVKRRCDLIVVNGFLYIGATIFLFFFALRDGHIPYNSTALALGLTAGVLVFVATLTFFYHMMEGVLTVSWTVIGLAVGFPVLASIFIWHETPNLKQLIGLALIPISLVLLSKGCGGDK